MKNILVFGLAISLFACQAPHTHTEDSSAHGHDHGSLPVLVFTEHLELFAETDQPYVKHKVEIRAHLTYLEGYMPAEKGNLYARICLPDSDVEWTKLKLVQAGIFTGAVVPGFSGTGNFEFKYEEGSFSDTLILPNLEVLTHDNEVPEQEHFEGAVFTKEQAWLTEFGLIQIKPDTFYHSVRCAAEFITNPNDLEQVLASTGGQIQFLSKQLNPGSIVSRGQGLFEILPLGIGDENIQVSLQKAQSELDQSRKDYERKVKLFEVGGVSAQAMELSKSQYEVAKSSYENISEQFKLGKIIVKSPVSGYVQSLLVQSGQQVNSGTPLLSLLKTQASLLKVDYPLNRQALLSDSLSLKIKLPGAQKTNSLDFFNGQFLQIGKQLVSGAPWIPVYFQGAFDQLPGSQAEVWVLTKPVADAIIIPKGGIIEEYGLYFAYVQLGGEVYEKKAIEVSGFDGENYWVSAGLELGDVVVSAGAMAVKVANALGAPPAHSH